MNRNGILFSLFASVGLLLLATAVLHPHVAAGQDQPPGETPTPAPSSGDYGDAPDSTNNRGVVPNTAYPSVPGNFPTSYQNTAAGSPAGPLHASPSMIYLGDNVSSEIGADFGPDIDGPNNIVNNSLDNADNDGFDDGWLNQDVPFPHCSRTTLEVRITRNVPGANNMYLNVWFDGNRNGEWGDQINCPNLTGVNTAREWIVVNDTINVGAIPLGSSQDFVITTQLVPNSAEELSHWIRFTLSEDPLPNIALDGRGPASPNTHDFGETEDYLYTPLPVSIDPGSITLTKTIDTNGPVSPRDIVTVQIDFTNDGNTVSPAGHINDILPAGLEYIGPISTNTLGSVTSSSAVYNAYSNEVIWRGMLNPNSGIRLSFPVEIGYCFGANQTITNTVEFSSGSRDLSDDATIEVDCVDASVEDITIERRIVSYDFVAGDYDRQANPNYYLPGNDVLIETRITNTSSEILQIGIEEKLDYQRPDLSPDPQVTDIEQQKKFISANSSVIVYDELSDHEMRNLLGISFHPYGELVSTITVCLLDLDDSECSNDNNKIQDTPWVFEVAMSDLGDAPASRNHAGIDMEAYPGVTANFPTVHDPTLAGDPGPIIINAQTLHLGRFASYEVEADELPDAIWNYYIFNNNIDPAAGLADQEGTSDTGFIFDNFDVADCETTDLILEIFPTDAAVSYFSNQTDDGNAYLNIYVDGNRDGDWQDGGVCGNSEQYSEHIVVNHPINVGSLPRDISYYPIIPTGNVPWDVAPGNISSSRWMRVMLTDRPVDLTSHGGSDAEPYLFGEIEDYLINNDNYPTLVEEQHPPVDIGIGFESPMLSDAPVGFRSAQSNTDYYRFVVSYANMGNNVVTPTLSISLDGSGTEKIERALAYNWSTRDLLLDQTNPCADVSDCDIELGAIGAREAGKLHIFFSVPAGTTKDDIIIEGEIISQNDPNPANNKAQLTFKPSFLPKPFIEEIIVLEDGGSGHTVQVSGLALPESDVVTEMTTSSLSLTGTAEVDVDGRWTTTFEDVEEGRYEAVSNIVLNGESGPQAAPVPFIVSDHPIITQFKLTDENGRTATVGLTHNVGFWDWARLLDLPPGTYQIDAKVTNANAETEIVLYNNTRDEIVSLADFDGDGIYSGELTIDEVSTRAVHTGVHELLFSIYAGETETITSAEIGVLDGEATVTDAASGEPISTATVTLYMLETGQLSGRSVTQSTLWDGSNSGQVNPASTGTSGQYSFLVAPGTYQLLVSAPGYQPYRSDIIADSRGMLSVPVALAKSISQEAAETILLDEQGGNQSIQIEPGDIVEFVNISNDLRAANGLDWDSGMLSSGQSYKHRFDQEGTFSIISGDSTFTLVVGDEAPVNSTFDILLPFIQR